MFGGERVMRKTTLHFEIVPVEVAQKILERQNSKAKHNGTGKRVVKKSGKATNGALTLPRKVEVLLP